MGHKIRTDPTDIVGNHLQISAQNVGLIVMRPTNHCPLQTIVVT
jgi:hypothetical protein